VGKVEGGDRARFAGEPLERVGIVGGERGKDLEGHLAPAIPGSGAIDLAHAAGTELGHDLVGA